ncbi:MAG: methyltransferase domain-containing protein [Epsilonproteobacteria bacterium]|nr:methyltransferase domain-containing protein [Campylobacterota bacterium]
MSSARKWDERYRAMEREPSVNETVKEFASGLGPGRALDLACGVGQNAKYLASLGFLVDAIDISHEALKRIGEHPGITPILADLRHYELPKERYDLIVVTNFLDRRLFGPIKEALRKDGVVIYETMTYEKKRFNPAYLLERNELLKAFGDLEVIYYRLKGERAALVARKWQCTPKRS